MKKFTKLILVLLSFYTFTYADFKAIDVAKLETLIEKGIPVIDVRRLDEWNDTGVIPGSHKLTFFDKNGNYDVKTWLSDFQKIVSNKKQEFVLVCRSSKRSGIVGDFLDKKVNYEKVLHLEGGILNWIDKKKKTVK